MYKNRNINKIKKEVKIEFKKANRDATINAYKQQKQEQSNIT